MILQVSAPHHFCLAIYLEDRSREGIPFEEEEVYFLAESDGAIWEAGARLLPAALSNEP